ncbi:uncharacterized protein MONOS_18126 [Monocercomonoides exilis]|uniref:uncharacterized protein n=1 Tax=Monocercomonoides exilis TaxID=2049356 RepID=UPI00355A5721|nr:hypothetical protein MONOS_18126 [Monocercomonoides exilis]
MWLQSLSIDHTSKCVPSPSVVKQTSPNGNVCAKDVSIASSLSGAVEDRVMACAVFVVYLSQLHLEDVTIARMRLAGPVLLEAGAAQTLMSKVGNITVENVSRTEGEGIMLSKRIEADERLQVQNVSIVECTCMAGDGGGMWIEMTEISSCVEVGGMGIETKMEHCSCSGGGGGVCLDVCKGGRELALDNLKFVECNCGGAGGKNIYVKGSEISESMINRKSFAFEFDENFYEDLVGFDRDVDGGVSFPLNVFFVEFKGLAHVGGRRVAGSGYGGSDASFCGFESFPCRTILYAASVRFNAGKRMIAVDEGYELREGIEMKDWEWEIWGSGSDLQMNVTEPDNLHSSRIISVEERASINAICSSGDTVLADVNYFVVCIKGGILRLVEFESKGMMRFCEGGLVNGDNAMIVEMKQCMLSRIEKTAGNGGCLKVERKMKEEDEEGAMIMVDGCNISESIASEEAGCGGGIWAKLDGDDTLTINGASVLEGCCSGRGNDGTGKGGGVMIYSISERCMFRIGERVKFSTEKDNKAGIGRDLFVKCGSGVLLSSKISNLSIASIGKGVWATDANKLSGSENGADVPVIPLFVFGEAFHLPLCVDGNSGVDHSHSGHALFACLTIDFCVKKRASGSLNEISIISNTSIISPISVSAYAMKVFSQNERKGIEVIFVQYFGENGVISCHSGVEFDSLSFMLKSTIMQVKEAFIISVVSLTARKCHITLWERDSGSESELDIGIIRVQGGELYLSEFSFEEDVRFTERSAITCKNWKDIVIEKSTFDGTKRVEGNGGCVDIGSGNEEGRNVRIENCTLTGQCVRGSELKGGGIFVTISGGQELTINDVVFKDCTVPEWNDEQNEVAERGSRGYGGGIFLEIEDNCEKFYVRKSSYNNCKEWKGSNIFVREELESLSEACGWERNTTGVGFAVPLVVYQWENMSGKGFVDGEVGGDFNGCGYSVAPCSTIHTVMRLHFMVLEAQRNEVCVSHRSALDTPLMFSAPLHQIEETVF